MKEFIEKLISRLEEKEDETVLKAPNTSDISNTEYQKWMMKSYGFKESIEIVNQLAEEYKDKTNIIDGLKAFLKDKFDYCAEQAEMNLEAECNSETPSYFRNRKELYLDRANIYGEVMREIDRLAEEYKGGWIPCGEKLPKENIQVIVTAEKGGHRYTTDAYFYNGKFYNKHYYKIPVGELNDSSVGDNVLAYMPLPAPYKENENDKV